MQVTQPQLQRQQLILQVLGFYHGKLDGIWGPESIEAKKRFEAQSSFRPGIPNNGMPFSDRPPYPAGMTVDHRSMLLYHPAIEKHLTPTPQMPTVADPDPVVDDQDEDPQ